MAKQRKAQDPLRNFTPFSGGGLISFTVTQDASPELRELAEKFPDYLSRALRHVAWRLQQEMKRNIRWGGPPGNKWKERSLTHIYRRMDYMRKLGGEQGIQGTVAAFKYLPLKYRRRKPYRGDSRKNDMMLRWRTAGTKSLRARGAMQGRMEQGIRYKKINAERYDIGAINPRVAQLLELAQKSRTEIITPKMRRAFWAAGVPISKDKTTITQPERDLINATYKHFAPHIEAILVDRIKGLMEGRHSEYDIPLLNSEGKY